MAKSSPPDGVRLPTLLVTVAEAQKILSVSRPTIYRLIAAGRLTALKVGGTTATRITMESIEKLIADSHRVGKGRDTSVCTCGFSSKRHPDVPIAVGPSSARNSGLAVEIASPSAGDQA